MNSILMVLARKKSPVYRVTSKAMSLEDIEMQQGNKDNKGIGNSPFFKRTQTTGTSECQKCLDFLFQFFDFALIIYSFLFITSLSLPNKGDVRTPDGPHGSVNPLQDSEFKKTGKLSLLKGQSSYSPLGGGGIIKDDDDLEGANL